MQLLTSIKRRWDSSDPERAPPPLPLYPSAGSPTTKANTSASIAAAAKQIIERARDSAPVSSYTANNTPQGSPERSLIKGAHHKRMQSLQTGSVKDLRSYLDNRSPERSPERPNSRGGSYFSRQHSSEDVSSPLEHTPTPLPASRDPLKETPALRPSTRQPPRSILGENTPPSATMLALQTMQVPEQPLSDITNGPSTPTPTRMSTTYDFSSQLLNLTTIATNLQREMTALSRRSKDNATDLVSLKDATHQRDEDIRKTLRDLANSVSSGGLLPPPPGLLNRSTSSYSNNVMDNKAYSSPPSASKTWNLPRAASAHGFLDDGRLGSPSPYSIEGAASVAMLEKIVREMVTKEGQERLLSTLSELLEKSQMENVEAAKKVEELAGFIKQKSNEQALVALPKDGGPPKLELNFDSPTHLAKITRGETTEDSSTAHSDEVMALLKRIKESVAHAGGATNEVKGLVRDLRGEVLGMGRELGRKLDQVSETQLSTSLDKSIEDGHGKEHAEEVQRIVEEGLAELKEHLSGLFAQRAEQDDNAFTQLATTRSGPNGDEMYAVVKTALAEHGNELVKREPDVEEVPALNRDGVLDAVKEGLKDFEPNIELQQFGLERDEILAVLKEGLEDYQNNRPEPAPAGIDKGEVYEVMQEALKDFHPSFPAEAMEQMKEDILANVQQALAEHQPVAAVAPALDDEATRAAVIDAVKEGLANHGPAAPREIEISRDDLFEAVKASLDGSTIPFGGFGEQVLQQQHDLIDGMRIEFKQYSAANGRDTEQVLDAVKDGLESLRAEIESYVDRAQDVTGKDEIIDTVKGGLEQLRADVQAYCAQGPAHDGGKTEMLDYIKAEFEHLHEAIGNGEAARGVTEGEEKPQHTAEIILAIKEGMDSLKDHVTNSKDRDLEIDFPTDEINDAMREEFEQLKGAILNANAADKSELIETIQESMGALHSKLNNSDTSTLSGGATEEIINDMRNEFATLKETMQSIVGESDRDAVIADIRQSIEDLRTQLSTEQSDASVEAVNAVREELERFKETMSTSMVLGGAVAGGAAVEGNNEHLESIRSSLDEIKETHAKGSGSGAVPDELLEAMRGEFENIRNSIATSMIHGGSNEEVLDAVRLGLDDLRSHLEKKMDSPERSESQHGAMLDALNEGLENLRSDVVKTLDKPLDMTVNYEILDTLKDGIASLRADLDAMKSTDGRPITLQGGEIVLADAGDGGEASRDLSDEAGTVPMPAPIAPGLTPADLERMEILLAQLQIKVEAMNNTLQDMPAPQAPQATDGLAMKEDLAALEGMIKDVQDNVIIIAARELEPTIAPEGAARKEDTDAIETLLRNTKSQLGEMVLPDPATAVTKEHLDAVEAVVRLTNEAVEGLVEKLDNTTAAKADVAVVEVLAQDVKTALEELKEKMASPASDEMKPELMTKADLDVLGVICTEIKVKVGEMVLPDPEELPSKADMEQLQGLIADFRESHDKMRESYETDIAVTAKAFDDRKQEFEDTVQQITGVKDSLAEIKDELLAKIGDGESGINDLGQTLKTIEEKSGNHEPVIAEVKEVLEALTREFERAHGSLESMKVDHQQSAETARETQAEHKETMVSQLTEKLDTLFDGLMSKYDDAQHAAEEKAKVVEEKVGQQHELLEGTKAMADDLRLSIDTLGSTLTMFATDFPERMEKLTDESKTVFDKVEETYNKLDETRAGLNSEHAATREEIVKVVAAIDVVQNDLSEHNPRFMVTLQELQALIGQHYEHSQKASDAAADHHQAVRELQEQLKAGFEDTKTRHESQTEELKTALPALLPPPVEVSAPVSVEKYDDSALHEKLDKLVGHAEDAANPSTQIERLDQIHEKVMATAAEVSAFVAAQAKQITEDHENKEKEAEEVALLLERRIVQRDEIEADITVLNEDKETLKNAVEALKAEREALATQKSRLAADVSSLETALQIRREELHDMDRKAETIERRMLEGVMNQSRMLLLAKTAAAKASAPKKKPQSRDLRDPSGASARTVTSTAAAAAAPALKKVNHALAMKARPAMQRNNGAAPNTAERRIMSLSQMSHNRPTGAHAFSTATPSLVSPSRPHSLKRSHSVKTQNLRRNLSLSAAHSHYNKENETLSEEDEDDDEEEDFTHPASRDADHEEFGSDAGTERRTSYAGDDDGSYTDGFTPSTDDGRRNSYGTGASDLSYDTGSYMTGSEVDRRTSLASSSANGVVGVRHFPIDEEEEEEELAPEHEEGIKRHFAPPSDSGLGTDLPTAALTCTDGEYFRSDAE